MFDQGWRWVVTGPGDAVLGYYETEEEAQGKANSLNAQTQHSPATAAKSPIRTGEALDCAR
jgi:hypothetical protein